MKIPFDIKYRPEIESGKYKVENREGRPVRIICWDKKSEKKYGYHIVALIEFGPQHEESTYFTIDGKGRLKDKEPELFIITPEPELTEFEQRIEMHLAYAERGMHDSNDIQDIKDTAKELLDLAKKELCKGCTKGIDEYWRGRTEAMDEMNRSIVFTNDPYYPQCKPCTNPHHDCSNCSYNLYGRKIKANNNG